MSDRPYSKRDRIRDVAERILREQREALRIADLAPRVQAEMAPVEVDQKTVNNSLHDDPKRRFFRVSIGTWSLKDFHR